MRIKKGQGKGLEDISFHYTKEEMVKDLLDLIKFDENDVVLDAGSGKNKVWYNNVNVKEKYECEIEDGCDFLKWDKEVDVVIGNPPYHLLSEFMDKATQIARKGIAFLVSIRGFNSLTPKRLEKYKERGFYLNGIYVVSDKRWYGRYYFLMFSKKETEFFSWKTKVY